MKVTASLTKFPLKDVSATFSVEIISGCENSATVVMDAIADVTHMTSDLAQAISFTMTTSPSECIEELVSSFAVAPSSALFTFDS